MKTCQNNSQIGQYPQTDIAYEGRKQTRTPPWYAKPSETFSTTWAENIFMEAGSKFYIYSMSHHPSQIPIILDQLLITGLNSQAYT